MRGCSLMVKPQSSKLITRVRFPSSPRTNPSDVVGGIFCARGCRESLTHADLFPRALGIRTLQLVIPSTNLALGCRESLPGENTFPRALGIFALQPVIPSLTSLLESLTHADLFPRTLGICTLQPVIPSTNPFRTLGNRLRRNPRPHPPFCWAFSGKTGKLGH